MLWQKRESKLGPPGQQATTPLIQAAGRRSKPLRKYPKLGSRQYLYMHWEGIILTHCILVNLHNISALLSSAVRWTPAVWYSALAEAFLEHFALHSVAINCRKLQTNNTIQEVGNFNSFPRIQAISQDNALTGLLFILLETPPVSLVSVWGWLLHWGS